MHFLLISEDFSKNEKKFLLISEGGTMQKI